MPSPASAQGSTALALRDILDALASVHVWHLMAWQEVKQRYRRSTLGPFWLTISMAILVGGMGPLYGRLFNQHIGNYFPYLAVGLILWQLISAFIQESGQVFISAEPYIKQIKMPLTLHVLRMVWRNAIVFAHNFVVILVVLIAFLPHWSWVALLALPGLAALLANGIWAGLLLGILCARFRDITPIVTTLGSVAFFLTPVMWRKEMLGRHQWAADLNPLHHFIDVIRGPLLGQTPSAASWLIVTAVTVIGFAVTIRVFARFRPRVAYWL